MDEQKSPEVTLLVELIEQVLQCTASDEQKRELQARLLASAEQRQVYLHHVNLHSALRRQFAFDGDEEMPAQLDFVGSVQASDTVHRDTSSWLRRASWTAIAAAAVVALIAIVFFRITGNPEVARITGLNGPVQWTGEGGRVEEITRVGRVLHGGTLESLSAGSWAELRFRDGTTVTVSGRSLLTLSEQEQKVLRLRYGSLSADVTPQPTDHPLLVHTSSADLQVLGTQFNVDAQAETTMLTVNEGRVHFKRLTDGKSVNVPAGHQAIASLDAQNGLTATPRSAGVSAWQSDLERDVIHGKWASNLKQLAGQLKKAVASGEVSEAEAIAQYKQAVTLDDQGSVWALPSPFGAFVWLRVSGWSAAPVVATPDAKFRVRGNLDTPTNVEIGISTYAPDGGFAGKYSVSLTADELRRDGDAFDVTLPLDTFLAKNSEFDVTPARKVIRDWWCVTTSNKAKLEITHVELIE